MKRYGYILLSLSLFFAGFLTACKTWAQNAVFSVNASADKIGINDQLQVDYTIQNVEDLRTVTKPNFKDFIIVGGPYQSRRSNVSIVNNTVVQSTSITHSYVLQPKKTGTLTVPSSLAKDGNGHSYESNSLTIQVVNGSLARQQQQQQQDPFDDPFGMDPFAAMQQMQRQMMQQHRQQQQPATAAQPADAKVDMDEINKNIFIRVSVDKSKAYVGEQITASYKLYTRIPMNVSISKLPSLNGFWTQDFEIAKGNIKPVEEEVDGKKYQVFLLKKSALFPQQTGTLSLDPAEAEGTARVMTKTNRGNPFDSDPFLQQFGSMMMSDPFFNQGMFGGLAYKDVPVHLKSPAVKIEVLPTPDKNKPEGYGGAVGDFTITGKIDKNELTTDDALTYTLKIAGSGNFKLIQAPHLPLPNGLTTYDPQVIDTITGRSTTISGNKIITYSISPNLPGDYQIPAIPFSYYNTQTGGYTTIYTQPVNIKVGKGKNYHPGLAHTKSLTDIHPIASVPLKELKQQHQPLFFSKAYWSVYALSMIAFIGLIVWKRRDDELSKDTIALRSKKANKIALRRLANAKKLLQQNAKQPFYEEVSKAIWLYISDKLHIPLSTLSKETAETVLAEKKIPDTLRQKINELVEECETALYAPGGGVQQMKQSYEHAVSIISELEEKI